MGDNPTQTETLSDDAVRAIADLARLQLTDAEITVYAGQLSDILVHFQQLQQLDTTHIAPTASVLPVTNVMRPDVPGAPLSAEQVVANAPDAEAYQFRVRAVLETE